MAAFRRFDTIQMQLSWRRVGCSPEWGRGVKGGDAASFCQLQGYPRRTQRGTKESGDGDPREMTANLDRAPPPARTGNRADRVFSPLAARHHWCNLQCLNPIWKRAWQHFGALTQFRCNCPGGGGVQPGMGAGCEGGGDRAIRTGNRRGIGRSRIRIDDAGAGNSRTRVYERLRAFTTSVCERLRAFVCERLRVLTSVCDECLRTIASVCECL